MWSARQALPDRTEREMGSHRKSEAGGSRRDFLVGLARLAGLAAVGGAASALLARGALDGSEEARRLELCRRCPRAARCPEIGSGGPPSCDYAEREAARRSE